MPADAVQERRGGARTESRLRRFLWPRLGHLRQHDPKPLQVPCAYFLTHPPRPAPTISVVTPSFGQGRFVERTLYSVLSQDYPAVEYIVQDGGSTDETPGILHRYDHLLAGWASEPDDGHADALNRGFRRTSGEIMAFLNSDDLLLPGSLAYVAGHFAANPGVDVVYGHRILIDEDDAQIGCWVLPRHGDRALALADYVPQETLFWRRSVWDAIGASIDSRFRYAIDWDLLLRLREVGARTVRLPRFLGAFRVHSAQKSTADADLGISECRLLRRRVHGRDLSDGEVLVRLAPYLLRHRLSQLRQEVAGRQSSLLCPVRTVPPDGWPAGRAGHPATTEGRLA